MADLDQTARVQPIPRGRTGHCRWCGKPVPKGRRRWCSQGCVDDALIATNPAAARAAVARRDHGVCSECGADAEQTRRVLNALLEFAWSRRQRPGGWGTVPNARDTQRAARDAMHLIGKQWGVFASPEGGIPHLWEADHIVPVVEGGGGCGLDNYRTLCRRCHVEATAELARRRARERHEAAMPLLGEI